MTVTLGELGEAELLRRLVRFAPPGQLSDDTAALGSDSRPLLVNTDVLVDGVHFSDATTSAADVGWRSVAANLSDLAASGAVAIDGITVALVAPGNTPWRWVEELYTGIAAGLNQFGGTLLGVTAPQASRDWFQSQPWGVWVRCACIAAKPNLEIDRDQRGPWVEQAWPSTAAER